MQQKLSFKQAVFIVALMMIALVLVIKFHGGPIKPVAKVALAEETISGSPIHLKIPSINVSAVIESTGITPNGEMGIPKGATTTAWFNLGPKPGEKGSAVIDGHFGWKDNLPAVFDNLNKLQKGDKIYVDDDKGITTTFVVQEIRKFEKNDSTSNIFNSKDNIAHLNLITCKGIWDAKSKSYSERLVVFSIKE